jgi:hypothetical protein
MKLPICSSRMAVMNNAKECRPLPVEICEALNVQHVHLINEQHTRHQLGNTCGANAVHIHVMLRLCVCTKLAGQPQADNGPSTAPSNSMHASESIPAAMTPGQLDTVAKGQLKGHA